MFDRLQEEIRICVGTVPGYVILPDATTHYLCPGKLTIDFEPQPDHPVFSLRPFCFYPMLEYHARCFRHLNNMPAGLPEGYVDNSMDQLRLVPEWDPRKVWHSCFYLDWLSKKNF